MDYFTHAGREFSIELIPDDDNGAPWENSDGNCEVTRAPHNYGTEYGPSKQPGEFVFHRGDCRQWSYCVNLPDCLATARADKWGIDDKTRAKFVRDNSRAPTVREVALLAVLANIEYLRGWCADDWQYVGVVVSCEGETAALWGVESFGDYIRDEVAPELADEIIPRLPLGAFECEGG